MSSKERDFTFREVSEADGQEGRPVYIVFERVVYDVTASPMWKTGSHMRMHRAGADLTEQLSSAPHWGEVFTSDRVRRIGVLRSGEAGRGLPRSIQTLFRLFPLARRHPHPIAVHFPTAYFIAAALFLLLHTLSPGLFGFDSEKAAAAMLIMGSLFSIVAIATGFFTLWVNYRFKMRPLVKRKLTVTGFLILFEASALLMRAHGPVTGSVESVVYLVLILLLAVCVTILGYLGGEMVFPVKAK